MLFYLRLLQDYDVERDKSGRIVTGTQQQGGKRDENRAGGGGGRERSRERDRGGERGEWDRSNALANQAGGGNWKYGNTYGLSGYVQFYNKHRNYLLIL